MWWRESWSQQLSRCRSDSDFLAVAVALTSTITIRRIRVALTSTITTRRIRVTLTSTITIRRIRVARTSTLSCV